MTATTTPLSEKAIRGMPAGRKIEALIHDRIFRKPVWCIHDAPRDREGSNHRTCIKCGAEFGDTTYAMAMAWLPHYSTDIAEAMNVLCKARGKSWDFSINSAGQDYYCMFTADGVQVAAAAGRISLAICRAALLKTLEEPCTDTH